MVLMYVTETCMMKKVESTTE